MSIYSDKRGGQALIELALIIPFLLLVIANVVNYGGMFYAAITVSNAARNASQNFIYGSATIRNTKTPTASQVWTLAEQDTSTLQNQNAIAIRVCLENRNDPSSPACTEQGPAAGTFAFTNPPIDTRAEGNAFLNGWVDVGYTYTPFIPLFEVPVMGISLSPPPQIIIRQSLMRVLN
jgi:uncharacterized protein (UPF0333 family)